MFEEIPNDWTCPACGDGNVHPRQHLAFLLASLTSFERFILLIVRNFRRKETFIKFDHYLQSNPEAKQEDIAKHIGKLVVYLRGWNIGSRSLQIVSTFSMISSHRFRGILI